MEHEEIFLKNVIERLTVTISGIKIRPSLEVGGRQTV